MELATSPCLVTMWGSTQVLQSLRPPDNVLVSRKETPTSTGCLHQKARRKGNQGVRLMLSLLLPLSLRRSLSGTRSHPSCLHHPQGQPNPHTHAALPFRPTPHELCLRCLSIALGGVPLHARQNRMCLSSVVLMRVTLKHHVCTSDSRGLER